MSDVRSSIISDVRLVCTLMSTSDVRLSKSDHGRTFRFDVTSDVRLSNVQSDSGRTFSSDVNVGRTSVSLTPDVCPQCHAISDLHPTTLTSTLDVRSIYLISTPPDVRPTLTSTSDVH